MNASWALISAQPALLDALEPLIAARQRTGRVQIANSIAEVRSEAATILMVGGAPPPTAFATSRDGRRVPLGWVGADRERLRVFARAAAEVASRQAQEQATGPAVLLGQRDFAALLLADEVERAAEVPLFRWTAERMGRGELLDALRCGPGLALYLGHALSGGWVAYGGVTAAVLSARRKHPLGAILTIAPDTARCDRTRLSFCDELAMRGACSAAVGATGKARYETDRVLARSIARGLTKSRMLGELLLAIPEEALRGYRIAGDPAAPLSGAAHAWQAASAVQRAIRDAAGELAVAAEEEHQAAIGVQPHRVPSDSSAVPGKIV